MIRSFVAAAAVGMITGVSAADSVSLNPNHDNTIFSELTSNSNGAGSGVFVGANLQGGARRALLSFDLSSIPAGATITSASLTMSMVQTTGGAINIGLYRVTNAWGEGGSNGSGQGAAAQPGEATWNERAFGSLAWASAGGDFVGTASSTKGVAGVGAYTWSSSVQMVADVQGWLSNPSSNFGWVMIGDEGVAGAAKRFASREITTASQRPLLTIEYTVPAPASLGLLGVAGLVARRRRR